MPICIPHLKDHVFNFQLYLPHFTQSNIKASIYFQVDIEHKGVLIDKKVYPREIIVRATQNHFRQGGIGVLGCYEKEKTQERR